MKRKLPTCMDCGADLSMTAADARFYGPVRCSDCFQEVHARMQDWLRGTPDRYFDAVYTKQRAIH